MVEAAEVAEEAAGAAEEEAVAVGVARHHHHHRKYTNQGCGIISQGPIPIPLLKQRYYRYCLPIPVLGIFPRPTDYRARGGRHMIT